MGQLTLIRHAHTAGNGPRPTVSGWHDLPLSEYGWHQLELLRARMLHEPPFDGVYASPLQRTRDTARVVAPQDQIVLFDALREIDCGDVDGLSVEDAEAQFPEAWAANLRQDDPDFRWPGGESYREFRLRCLGALRSIANAHPGERVAVVTHAGVVSQIVGFIQGLSPARWECYRPANTSLTEIEWGDGRPMLVRFDDHSHLVPLGIGAPHDAQPVHRRSQ